LRAKRYPSTATANRSGIGYTSRTPRVIASLMDRGEAGRVYNIPGGQLATNIEIVSTIAEIAGVEPKLKFVADRPGHDRILQDDHNPEV